jgi:hypothetical protein
MVNAIHLAGPAGSHTSQPDLTTGYKVANRTGFLYNYFLTGKDDIDLFSIPSDTRMYPYSHKHVCSQDSS